MAENKGVWTRLLEPVGCFVRETVKKVGHTIGPSNQFIFDYHLGNVARFATNWSRSDLRPYPTYTTPKADPLINDVPDTKFQSFSLKRGETLGGMLLLETTGFRFKEIPSAIAKVPTQQDSSSSSLAEEEEEDEATILVKDISGKSNLSVFIPYLMIDCIEMQNNFDESNPVQLRIVLRSFQCVHLEVPGTKADLLFRSLCAKSVPKTCNQLLEAASLSVMEGSSGGPLIAQSPDYMPSPVDSLSDGDTSEELEVMNKVSRDTDSVELESTGAESQEGDGKDLFGCSQWITYEPEIAYNRMGVQANANWRQSDINKEYALCASYPSVLFVPEEISDAKLEAAAKFRSQGRIPVLSFLHNSGAAISRSAQPLSGISSRRSEDDEDLVRALFRGGTQDGNRRKSYIVDARPKLNALVNQAAGKGYENKSHYGENCEVKFLEIDNIHTMRGSLKEMLQACQSEDIMYECLADEYYRNWTREGCDGEEGSDGHVEGQPDSPSPSTVKSTKLDERIRHSHWLHHVRRVLLGATFVANTVGNQHESVLVHCSDGWDRTSQLTALAQIILEPCYRTIDGFRELIQKEWLSFGHKFEDRCTLIGTESNETSPVFLQFLDCVWQMMQQCPEEFQFNEKYLLGIHGALMSRVHGTFMCNNEKDRISLTSGKNTSCLWTALSIHVDDYKNASYKPSHETQHEEGASEDQPSQQKAMLGIDFEGENSTKFWKALYMPATLPFVFNS